MSANVTRTLRPDGTEHITVRPDPVVLEIAQVCATGTMRRKFAHRGSLVNAILELRAAGVQRITFTPQKLAQVERELRARGMWETHKDLVLGDT